MLDIKILASGSSGNAYIISDGESSLLLDAGIPFKEIMIGSNFNISSLNGCLVTHSHMDHCKAVKDLVKHGITVYTSFGTIDVLGLRVHYGVKAIRSKESVAIGTFKVLAFDVEHDAPEPLGFLVESLVTGDKLLYFTDTYYLKYKFNGLNYILGECNYSKAALDRNIEEGTINTELAKRLYKSHMSLETFKEFIEANDMSKVQQIYLLHLSNANSEEDRFKREIQALTGTEVYVC